MSPFNCCELLASKEGLLDEGGSLGASGRVNDNLLLELQSWHYYETASKEYEQSTSTRVFIHF